MSTTTLTSPSGGVVDEPPWTRRKLRVPREDSGLLVRPTLFEAVAAVETNRRQLGSGECNLLGVQLSDLRLLAKRDLLQAARSYLKELGLAARSAEFSDSSSLVLSGHQPELFHPGVWIKNFALARIAASANAIPVNLVIDNDLLAKRAIRIPVGTAASPSIQELSFDASHPVQPWEDATIVDRETFDSFAQRAVDALKQWGVSPLLTDMWPNAVQQSSRSLGLRDALTVARASMERRWGIDNLEVPFSRVCQQPAFARFAVHLLAHLPRFRAVHNSVLAEFRVVNRVRSQTRPVPELAELDDGWLEAPFWVWSASDPQRRRMFARQVESRMELSDGHSVFAELSITADGDGNQAVGEFSEFAERGIRFRTRALTTTLFSRLVLGDYFVHGIGGAKYDEVTDRIMWRFYNAPAPNFLTISATKHLPLAATFPASRQRRSELVQRLRDIEWNPDRYIERGANPGFEHLIDEKQKLIQDQHAAETIKQLAADRKSNWRKNMARRSRFEEIRQQLSATTTEPRGIVIQELKDFDRKVSANRIFRDREFAFCLFPEQVLQSFFADVQVE